MKIRNIVLSYDDIFPSGKFEHKFRGNAEFVGYYLTSASRKAVIETNSEYKAIWVAISPQNDSCKVFLSVNVLEIYVHWNQQNVDDYNATVSLADRCEIYLSILEKGYHIAAQQYDVPISQLLALHDQFRRDNYKVEWLKKKLYLRKYNFSAQFKSYLLTDKYQLKLHVIDRKTKKELRECIIFTTPPYWESFYKNFTKIYIQDNYIMMDDFLDKNQCKINMDSLVSGPIELTYTDDILQRMEEDAKEIVKLTW